MIEGLRATGADLEREKLLNALAGMRRLDLGDFALGFAAQVPFVASQYSTGRSSAPTGGGSPRRPAATARSDRRAWPTAAARRA